MSTMTKNEARQRRKIRIRKKISGTADRPRLVVFRKAGAEAVGKENARLAKEKNIDKVVFDRNGYLYHGKIKAVADGAREGGLEF